MPIQLGYYSTKPTSQKVRESWRRFKRNWFAIEVGITQDTETSFNYLMGELTEIEGFASVSLLHITAVDLIYDTSLVMLWSEVWQREGSASCS